MATKPPPEGNILLDASTLLGLGGSVRKPTKSLSFRLTAVGTLAWTADQDYRLIAALGADVAWVVSTDGLTTTNWSGTQKVWENVIAARTSSETLYFPIPKGSVIYCALAAAGHVNLVLELV